jgi:hypothetical protein
MKHHPSPPSRLKSSLTGRLTWSHYGVLHRVICDPSLRFERQEDGEWIAFTPDPAHDCFASGAVMLDARAWNRFLEFVPPAVRDLITCFGPGRLAALAVWAQCPALLTDLLASPALVPFLARHVPLRGGQRPAWSELIAIHEREGIFGVLAWLGLPSSPQTLRVLARVSDPDLPRRLLAPLRASLWDPASLWALQRSTVLGERELMTCCHALAA